MEFLNEKYNQIINNIEKEKENKNKLNDSQNKNNNKNVYKLLIGNKSDLESNREIKKEG